MQHRPGGSAIVIRGARQNNLKNLTLEIPTNELVVDVGLALGSGAGLEAPLRWIDRTDEVNRYDSPATCRGPVSQ
jgi:hypothetical protein